MSFNRAASVSPVLSTRASLSSSVFFCSEIMLKTCGNCGWARPIESHSSPPFTTCSKENLKIGSGFILDSSSHFPPVHVYPERVCMDAKRQRVQLQALLRQFAGHLHRCALLSVKNISSHFSCAVIYTHPQCKTSVSAKNNVITNTTKVTPPFLAASLPWP